MTIRYKTEKQQEVEFRWDYLPLDEVLTRVLTEFSGQPQFIQNVTHRLRISEPTLRQWCRDFGIDFHAFKVGGKDADPT